MPAGVRDYRYPLSHVTSKASYSFASYEPFVLHTELVTAREIPLDRFECLSNLYFIRRVRKLDDRFKEGVKRIYSRMCGLYNFDRGTLYRKKNTGPPPF